MPCQNDCITVSAHGHHSSFCRCGQTLKWVGTHGNAVPKPAISVIWRSQASKSAFLRGNACSQAGKIVLSMGTQLVNLNLVKINDLTRNTGARCKIERAHRFLQGPGPGIFTFSTTLKLHFNRWLWLCGAYSGAGASEKPENVCTPVGALRNYFSSTSMSRLQQE